MNAHYKCSVQACTRRRQASRDEDTGDAEEESQEVLERCYELTQLVQELLVGGRKVDAVIRIFEKIHNVLLQRFRQFGVIMAESGLMDFVIRYVMEEEPRFEVIECLEAVCCNVDCSDADRFCRVDLFLRLDELMMNNELTSSIFLIFGNLVTVFSCEQFGVVCNCLRRNLILSLIEDNEFAECNGLFLILRLIQKDHCFFDINELLCTIGKVMLNEHESIEEESLIFISKIVNVLIIDNTDLIYELVKQQFFITLLSFLYNIKPSYHNKISTIVFDEILSLFCYASNVLVSLQKKHKYDYNSNFYLDLLKKYFEDVEKLNDLFRLLKSPKVPIRLIMLIMRIVTNWIPVLPSLLSTDDFKEAFQNCLNIERNGASFDFKIILTKLIKLFVKHSIPKDIEFLVDEGIILDLIDLIQSENIYLMKMSLKTILIIIKKLKSTKELFLKNGIFEVVHEICDFNKEINELCQILKMRLGVN